jgi:hypothetical protein
VLRPSERRAVAADVAPDAGSDVAAYLAELDRLGAEGGQVVVDGMRPGLADIAHGRLPDDVLARMADGWLASMRQVQADVRGLAVPTPLAHAAVRVERALHVYVRLAERLRDAAAAHGDERDLLIDEAVLLGQEADRLYDEALAMLSEVRP